MGSHIYKSDSDSVPHQPWTSPHVTDVKSCAVLTNSVWSQNLEGGLSVSAARAESSKVVPKNYNTESRVAWDGWETWCRFLDVKVGRGSLICDNLHLETVQQFQKNIFQCKIAKTWYHQKIEGIMSVCAWQRSNLDVRDLWAFRRQCIKNSNDSLLTCNPSNPNNNTPRYHCLCNRTRWTWSCNIFEDLTITRLVSFLKIISDQIIVHI